MIDQISWQGYEQKCKSSSWIVPSLSVSQQNTLRILVTWASKGCSDDRGVEIDSWARPLSGSARFLYSLAAGAPQQPESSTG